MADTEDKAKDKAQAARQGRQGSAPRKGRQGAGGGEGREERQGRQGRQGRGRRQGRAEGQDARGEGHASAANLFRRAGPQEAGGRVQVQQSDAGAGDREDRHQHGHRRGRQRPQEGRPGGLRSQPDRRPEAGHHQGAQVDRDLQAARRPGDRLQGHAAQEADVRVRRPAGEHRAAARARFPRAQSRRASTAAATTPSASRNTSFSPRSTTTRQPISGAWTSRFAPARRPTTRRARCSPHSTSRSGSEGRSVIPKGGYRFSERIMLGPKPSNAESQET